MFNNDIVLAILITLGFVITVVIMKKTKFKFDYYSELKMALLLASISFKDIKLKKIADICITIVIGLEKTNKTAQEKKAQAMKEVTKKIRDKLNLQLDEEVVSVIIDIAVSYMQSEK